MYTIVAEALVGQSISLVYDSTKSYWMLIRILWIMLYYIFRQNMLCHMLITPYFRKKQLKKIRGKIIEYALITQLHPCSCLFVYCEKLNLGSRRC